MATLLDLFAYWDFAILLMVGFYAVIAKANLIKKLMGLALFQAAVDDDPKNPWWKFWW